MKKYEIERDASAYDKDVLTSFWPVKLDTHVHLDMDRQILNETIRNNEN